ncbi:SDR family oxidoreductase [Gilvimarinus sp. SDUM040013]|uniref:SDR family oxidoreductase n=1 Tax=Gilvimarinus gilvus TaxID=3058038 RepID=A0ABU4RSG7_9GAMM|nr:SDR family oxidoreductase [Gilvimarinus sp. SDUM040013]MDO3388278.1 SDR family oxidoreductase [Gilvimarinus sp. SDUM040013]MDX6847828.1 SDR family oxidoreductase [Gilvimarinus sp. SDUM040013]
MNFNGDFAGKTVLVVGGTSGICRGIAERFAGLGCSVCVMGRSQEKIDSTVAALEDLGAQDACGFSVDVREGDMLRESVRQLHARWGALDIVVSGAAGNFPALASGLSDNGFGAVVDIDLKGTFHVMSAVYPYLRKPGASVINISAPQAQLAMAGQVHVCAAKAGVDMITRTLCIEWGGEGIRVNSIIPGPIEGTEGMERLAPGEAMRSKIATTVPLRRLGRSRDIADASVFLSSSLASYISGAVLPVDGGWSLGGAASIGTGIAQMLQQQQ